MPRTSAPLRVGALLCFVLADGVAAHPQPPRAIDGVRLIGPVEASRDADAYQTGKRLLANGDAVGALAAFREATKVSAETADAMNGMGVCYDQLGRPDLARMSYEAGLAVHPTSPQLLNNLGYSRFLAGDYAAAIPLLRAAAASTEPAAAAAAKATLARLAAPGRTTTETVAEPQPVALIELTTDGEQRLTFAPAAAAASAAGTDLDGADAMVVVAATWTPADDEALVARVHGEEAADAAERDLADARASASSASPPVALVEAALARLSVPVILLPHATGDPLGSRTLTNSRLVLNDSDAGAPVLRRRGATARYGDTAAVGEGPKQRDPAMFDSDDLELNAFAARVKTAVAVVKPAPAEHGRIAAMFRT